MNDRYHKFASSNVGQRILASLNLPTPAVLERAPFRLEKAVKGCVLIGSTRNSVVLQQVMSAMKTLRTEFCLPESNQSLFKGKAAATMLAEVNWIRLEKLRSTTSETLAGVVFDATELNSGDALTALYRIFHPVIDTLKPQSRILLLGKVPAACKTPEAVASQEGLQGFVRSLGKELGARGITVNLVYLGRPASCDLLTTLAYFLGDASAFVSGQTLTLRGTAAEPTTPETGLAGKSALVTGAARGIGAAIAESLHRQGARIIGVDLESNQELLKATLKPLKGKSLLLDVVAPDAADSIQNMLEKTGTPLDVIVHNAGVTRDKTLRKMAPTQWTQVLDVNLNAVMKINRQLLEADLLASNGRIICLSSIAGIAGNYGQTNYATSKAALCGYVRYLAKHLPAGITANAIAPGFIETAMTQAVPLTTREIARRINSLSQGGLPVDIAEAVAYLCHPGSSGLSGQTLRVCGLNPLGR
jgi:3-oxoacyl-[acyl-carrier protein] reductase